MIAFGVVLIALSLGDALAGGLAGEPTSRRDIWDGIAAALAVGLLGGWLTGFDDLQTLLLGALAAAVAAAWLHAKGAQDSRAHDPKRQVVALWLLAAGLLLAFSLSGFWNREGTGFLGAWLESIPAAGVGVATLPQLVVVSGVLLFLAAPANGVVRAVLHIASNQWTHSEQVLRGGRYIGTLERWLVFGFVVAGDPTGAALIVSAKSLLRFPEVSSAAAREREADGKGTLGVDSVSEYFLLGSLTSWALAFAAALLI